MSTDPRDIRDVVKFLRQREDLGLGEIFLERLTRDQVLLAAAEARRGARTEWMGTPEQETARADPS